ncbi:MAG: PASTA domain-containing protein [Candidatus Cloacimonadales bacterium]
MKKKKISAFILAVLAMIIIFIIAFFGTDLIMKLVVGHGNEVEVPDLVGTNINVGIKRGKAANLYVEIEKRVNDDSIEKDAIISQTPHSGIKTKEVRTIAVVVSDGPEIIRMPNLANLSLAEARLKLSNLALKLGDVEYRYSNDVSKGNVIKSYPLAEDLIARKSSVDLYVSLGMIKNSASDSKWQDMMED